MKFKTLSGDFVRSISLLSKITNTNSLNPDLECIYLRLDNNNLVIRVTNLEVVIEQTLNVKGEINGEVLIKPEVLVKVLNNINQNLNLEVLLDNNLLKIEDENKNEYIFEIFKIEEIPGVPRDTENIISIKKEQINTLIKSVLFCAAKTEIKPEIASVYIYKNNDTFVAVATDSYRLAEKTIYINNILEKDFNVILPHKNIVNILPVLDQMSEDINIETYQDGIIIRDKKTTIATRVVNGNFPDYRQLFPKEFNFELSINNNALLKSLQISSSINPEYNFCELNILNKENKILIKAKEKSVGSVKNYIDYNVQKGEVEDFSINYNSNYFLEGVQKIGSENVILKYTTQNKPVFINGEVDLSFKYLLMPLNR